MKKVLIFLACTCFLSACLCSCSDMYNTTDKISGTSSDSRVTYTFVPDDYLIISGTTDASRPFSSSDIPEQIAARINYIELGSGITALGTDCLAHFKRLKFIRIPQTVLYIESDVFDACPNRNKLTVWFDIEWNAIGSNGYSYSLNDQSNYDQYWAMKYSAEVKRVMDDVKQDGYILVADYPTLPFYLLCSAIDDASSEDVWLALDLQGYSGSVTDFGGPDAGSVARKVNNLTLDPNQSFMNLMDWEWEALDDFQIYELSLPDTVTSITAEIIEILHSGAPENLRIYYWGTRDEWNTLTSGWDWNSVSQWEVYTSDDY